MSHYAEIRDLLGRVRRRWLGVRAMHAVVRASLAAALVIAAALVLARWTAGAPGLLAFLGLSALLLATAGVIWGLLPLRRRPTDRQVARFIEERDASLDDRLVTAVDVASGSGTGAGFVEPMIADAARRAQRVDVDAIIPRPALRAAGTKAAAAVALLLAVVVGVRHTARQAADAAALALFPARVAVDVTPGNVRVKSGAPLTITARLRGNTAPVAAQVQVADGEAWRGIDMGADDPGAFHLNIDAVSRSFTYRVIAGAAASATYDVTVVHPPRVKRIDVDYSYPAGLRLPPRTERDGGDIYAPAGTEVRLHVITDQPAAGGRLVLGGGRTLDLAPARADELTAGFKVTEDGSYRVAVADSEGLSSAADTEYFIRLLEDRAPDVRITRPASDRSVTRLEEVDVEAQAEDDYGIDRLDLVYSVRGEQERVVPLKIPRQESSVTGRHTLYLEDLDVQPGDFISYYVRARDLTRGTRPNEARSDIFFLEVKPYEQEFALAQSQASATGGGGRGSIDELVAAQKEIIVATWKLDRRALASKGAKSEQDIRSVAKAEAELKTRVEQASSAFRETTMRDPRRRTRPQRGAPPAPDPLRAGETMPEEDEMTAAAAAMARAVTSLEALETANARAPEMEALNHLLRAQADVKKREVTRQAGSGNGSNRSNYDLSNLFDKELQKQQQTNYETRSTAEQRIDPNQSALDKVRELARRQDELLRQQQELARKRQNMSEEELRRQLEKLTREQAELRRDAEEAAKQMASQSSQGSQGSQGAQGSGSSEGAKGSKDSRQEQLRDVSEAMRAAATNLRRQEQDQAAASAGKALDKLRELERQMQAGRPDERQRALGEMRLEARQLADAERQLASELNRTAESEAARDALRRMAGDQARLADRTRRLQDALAAQTPSAGIAKDLERQKLADRMQQTADAMRAAADGKQNAQPAAKSRPDANSPLSEAKRQAGMQQELARALDGVADKLAASGDNKDSEAGKLSDQLARIQELQGRINELSEQMRQLAGQSGRAGSPNQSAGRRQPSASGQNGRGERGAEGTGASNSPGDTGRAGQGQGGGGGAATEAARLREEAERAMQQTRELMEQLRRDDPSVSRGGAGFTFEGQGLTASAPGTEAFKQDFAKWDDLRRQASQALEAAETAVSKKLHAQESKERFAAGADDKAPPEYQKQVDDYFKAIAAKKKGS